MLIHLTMMLSTVSGWGLPSDGEVNGSLVNKSEIADQVDDARDGHRRLKIGCDSSWSATAAPGPASPSIPLVENEIPASLKMLGGGQSQI